MIDIVQVMCVCIRGFVIRQLADGIKPKYAVCINCKAFSAETGHTLVSSSHFHLNG